MNRALLGLVLPGLLVVPGGTALVIASTGANIASDVAASAADLVEKPEFSWARVDADLRDVVITGTATNPAAVDALVAQISELPGVRSVENEAVLAEFVSPFPFSARREGGVVFLEGGIPDEAVRSVIAQRLPQARDQLELLSGAPDRQQFLSLVDYAITLLSHLDSGSVVAEDLDLIVKGRAASREDFAALAELRRQGPPLGLKVLRANIEPPEAEVYEIVAKNDGSSIVVSGFVPDNRSIAQITAIAGVEAKLELASGAPQDFVPNVLEALEMLALLDYGELRILGDDVTLSGAPPDAQVAAAVREAMASLGATLDLEPPRVAEYRLTGTKDLSGLSFIGSVPDEAIRSRLAQTDRADIDSVNLARGAPSSFEPTLDFALSVLSRLSEGEVVIEPQGLTVFGRATGPADFDAIEALLEDSREGVTVLSAEIRPPVASPFTWSVDKTGDGDLTVSGHVPSRTDQAEIIARFQGVDADLARIADGAPSGFAASTVHAAELIGRLSSGRVAFDGNRWRVSGIVSDAAADVAIRRYLAANNLLSNNWAYSATLPAAERAALVAAPQPFRWQAEKLPNGQVNVTGFSPSASFRDLVARRAADSTDETTLGQGAPAGFAADAMVGLEALLRLAQGTLSFDGKAWALSGVADTTADNDAARQALASRWDDERWQFAVEAQDLPPVATPYTFMAVRSADGATTLSGHLLSEDLRRMVMIKAGAGALDQTIIATGEPQGFVADVLAGLDALSALETGTLTYNGSVWSLSGRAAAEVDTRRVEAALARSAQGSAAWTQSIIIPEVPQAVASNSESAAAEPPAPETLRESAEATPEVGTAPATEAEPASTIVPEADAAPSAAPDDRPDPEPTIEPTAPQAIEPAVQAEPRMALAPQVGVEAQQTTEPSPDTFALLAQCQAEVDALASRNAILFRSGSDALTDESLPVIDELAGYIAHCPAAIVHVEGHTDADGADDLNLALSVARAEAVVFALMDRGVDLDRLYALGYGESLPIADNDTAAGKQRNRRIEFKILEDNR